MNEKNRLVQPFTMVFSVTAILLVLSLLNTEFSVFDYKTKKIDPLGDIILKGAVKKTPLPGIALNDSLIAKDSTALALRQSDPANIFDFELDSTSSLAHFFEALNKTRKTKNQIRIAYFGDSMIEGDLISQDLRGNMQEEFGGYGVGFVPVTSIVAGFRTSVRHTFDGWSTHNLLDPPGSHPLGISGSVFVPSSGASVKYSTVNKSHIDKFYSVRLLYGRSGDDDHVTINGYDHKLSGKNAVNEINISSKGGMQSLQAIFQCKSPIDVFGFSMESDSGAFVDNFSFRGNSGMPITKVTQNVYSETNQLLDYDLIILEYGLNAIDPDVTDYSWYERGMNNAIKHIRASFPNTSILLISVGDRGHRKDGVWQTDPSVPIMVECQKRMAKDNKLAFWSLYDAMGGNGSMVKWVEGDTAYANKDYTHFNFKGAHRVGKILFDKLMSEYSDYNKKQLQKTLN